jgi:hypothetical protein
MSIPYQTVISQLSIPASFVVGTSDNGERSHLAGLNLRQRRLVEWCHLHVDFAANGQMKEKLKNALTFLGEDSKKLLR